MTHHLPGEQDFGEVKKELEEISSYEGLLKRKEVEKKKGELDRFVNIISNRANALLAQSLHQKAEDKLGKTSDFYFDVISKIKGEPDKFLEGDIDKQHKLFELFVSTDLPNPRAVEHILSDIEGILKKRV